MVGFFGKQASTTAPPSSPSTTPGVPHRAEHLDHHSAGAHWNWRLPIARQQLHEGVAQVGGRFGILVLWQHGGLALEGMIPVGSGAYCLQRTPLSAVRAGWRRRSLRPARGRRCAAAAIAFATWLDGGVRGKGWHATPSSSISSTSGLSCRESRACGVFAGMALIPCLNPQAAANDLDLITSCSIPRRLKTSAVPCAPSGDPPNAAG